MSPGRAGCYSDEASSGAAGTGATAGGAGKVGVDRPHPTRNSSAIAAPATSVPSRVGSAAPPARQAAGAKAVGVDEDAAASEGAKHDRWCRGAGWVWGVGR